MELDSQDIQTGKKGWKNKVVSSVTDTTGTVHLMMVVEHKTESAENIPGTVWYMLEAEKLGQSGVYMSQELEKLAVKYMAVVEFVVVETVVVVAVETEVELAVVEGVWAVEEVAVAAAVVVVVVVAVVVAAVVVAVVAVVAVVLGE